MATKLVLLFAIALWVPGELLGQAETERAWTILDQGVADPSASAREPIMFLVSWTA